MVDFSRKISVEIAKYLTVPQPELTDRIPFFNRFIAVGKNSSGDPANRRIAIGSDMGPDQAGFGYSIVVAKYYYFGRRISKTGVSSGSQPFGQTVNMFYPLAVILDKL